MQNLRYPRLPEQVRESVDSRNQQVTQRAIAAANNVSAFNLSTERFARLNVVEPGTVRKRFCQTGSYFGIRPIKLASGRLLWPDVRASMDLVEAA